MCQNRPESPSGHTAPSPWKIRQGLTSGRPHPPAPSAPPHPPIRSSPSRHKILHYFNDLRAFTPPGLPPAPHNEMDVPMTRTPPRHPTAPKLRPSLQLLLQVIENKVTYSKLASFCQKTFAAPPPVGPSRYPPPFSRSFHHTALKMRHLTHSPRLRAPAFLY